METPTSTGTVTQPAPLKPWKQVAEESNIFSLPPEQRIAEYDKWSAENVAQGIRDGDFDSPDTFDQFKLFDIRTRKNLASDDIIGPSDDEVVADYNAFKGAFASTQAAFSANKPTPQDEAIQGEVLQGKRKSAFVRGQMVFNPAVVNDPQKYREAILESDAPSDIKMFYAGLRPEMEKSATITRRRELANNVITRDVADRVVTAIQEGTELFGADIGTPQSPALKKNKDGIWSVVDPEYSDKETSFLGRANAKYNPLADSLYKPFAAINEYQQKYGLTDEQVQQDYMESLIENAPTSVNRWFGKATSIEEYVKQLDSTVRVKNKDVAPEVRVQDPNLFFDPEGYNAAVDKAKAPDEAKTFAKEARTQFADAVAGDIYNNLLNNRDDFRENYAKNVVDRKDMEKAITRYYKDKKDQAWYDDVGETIGQAGTALKQGGMDLMMMPSAIKGMFGDVEAAEDYRYYTLAQKGEMQAEEAVANRTGGAGFIKLNNDVMRIIPDLVVQMGIAVATGGTLSGAQASLIAARTGISRAAATTALRQAAITGEKTALKFQLLKLIPEVTAKTVDDVAEEVLKASARTVSNNPFKGGIGTQRAVGSAYAGLTSASSTFGQVYTDVRNMGKSPEESIATARTAGIVAGAITSGLTHSFGMLGRGGVEDFASMGRKAGEFTIKDIVNAGMLDSLKTPEGRQLIRNIAKGISKDALSEGAEEGLDQALNLISQYATNPSPEAQNRKATDIINESLYGSLLGILAGGGAASVGQARATAPGITAQQMQAEILGAQQPPVAPQAAAPPQQPPVAGVPPVQPQQPPVQAPAPVVPSANPAVQNAQAVANAAAAIPNTSQTAAALAALANAAANAAAAAPLPAIPSVQPAANQGPVAAPNQPVVPAVAPINPPQAPTQNQPTAAGVSFADIDFVNVPILDKNTGKFNPVSGASKVVDLSGRRIVMVDVNGVLIPFYVSTGLGGKKAVQSGKWYPFFGLTPDGWINKLDEKAINSYYGSPILRNIAEQLDRDLGPTPGPYQRVGPKSSQASINRGLTALGLAASDDPKTVELNVKKIVSIIENTQPAAAQAQQPVAPAPSPTSTSRADQTPAAPAAAAPESAPVNAEETPIEPTPTPAKVEPEPTENMKTETKFQSIDEFLGQEGLFDLPKYAADQAKRKAERTSTDQYLVYRIDGYHVVDEPSKGDQVLALAKAPTKTEVARDATKPEQMTPDEYAADNFAIAKQKFLSSRGEKEGRAVSVIQAEYDQAKIDEEDAKKAVNPYITKDGKGIRKGQETAILPFQKTMREAKDRREVLEKELRQAEKLDRDLAIEQRPSTQTREIGYAVGSFRPVSSAAVDAYSITLPSGYVKQGELYVYQPEQKAEAPVEVSDTQVIPEKTLKEISAYPDFSYRVTGGNMLDASDVSRYLAFRESTTSIPKTDVAKAKKDLKNPTVSEIEAALSKYAEERNRKTQEGKDISAALKRAGESDELDIAISNYNQAKSNLDAARIKRNNPIAGVQWEAKLLSSQVGDAQKKLSDAGKKLIAVAGKVKQPKPTKQDAVQEPSPDISIAEPITASETPEPGDEVGWTTGRGDKATSLVGPIRFGNAQVEWFGIKYVPLGELTLIRKSARRINREKREAGRAAAITSPEPETPSKEFVFSKKEIAALNNLKTPEEWKIKNDGRMNMSLIDTQGREWNLAMSRPENRITLTRGADSYVFVKTNTSPISEPEQKAAGQEGEVKPELTESDKKAYAGLEVDSLGSVVTRKKRSEIDEWLQSQGVPESQINPASGDAGIGQVSVKEGTQSRQFSWSKASNVGGDSRLVFRLGDNRLVVWMAETGAVHEVSPENVEFYEAQKAKPELTPEQNDVVVFVDIENDTQEKAVVAAEKKKRITPGKARKVGIAIQIDRLGITSKDPASVIEALKKIAAKPLQKHHGRIARDLLSILKDSGVQIQLVSGNDARMAKHDSRVNGWYDPKTNTAYINLDGPHELGIEETILHELVHASGEKVIQNPQTDAQKRILADLEKQMLAARKNAIALGQAKMGVDVSDLKMLIDMAAAQNDYGLFDILYGVSSLSEYHAHATTSRSFQKFLATYKEGGKRSLMERFVNSITSLLSGKKTADGSDAEKAYATLLDLMRENKGDVRLSNADAVASKEAVSVTDVVMEPIPKSETKKLDALPDDATIEDISQASPRLIEQSKALAIKFKDFASWSAAATKAFGSKAARFLETIWTGLKSISIAAIIGYTVTGVDPAFAPSIQEVGKLTQEDAVSVSYILPEAPPQQELVAVSISEPVQRPIEIAKPPTQKAKTVEDKITESLSSFDSSVSHYVDFADTEFELEILNSVEPTTAMMAVAPLIGEIEGNKLSGPNKTLEKVFEVGGIRASQDEVPWCAMFISHGLNKAGTPTRNVMASQFLSFGKKTSTPKTGDVVVFNKRNDDNTISPNTAGHVGFFIRESGDFVLVLNGNVGDGVAVTALPKRRVMQYRSAPAVRADVIQSRARGTDAEYMAAAESGDEIKARGALDQAAKEAGIYKGISARVSAWARDDVSEETMTARATDPETEDRVSFEDVVTDLSSMSDDDAALEYVRWLQDLPNKNEMAEDVISDIAGAARIPATITRDANGNVIPLSQRFQQGPQSRARGRFDLVDAVRAASSGDASTPFQALNEAINANAELTRRIQAESERRSRAYARGKGAILEQIIRAGNTGRLPEEAIKPITDFVNSVSPQALADTRISLSAKPQNSTFDFVDSLVTLALNGMGSEPGEIDRTAIHEFWHGLSRFIPDDEIEKIRKDYVAAVKEYISENPWFVPFIGRTHLSEAQYDDLSRMLSKEEMDAIPWKNWETLEDGRRIRGLKWTKDNYRLFRLDEWVAETMADLVRRKQERPTTFLGKMARLFRDFIDTLKQALGNPYLKALDAMTVPDEAFDAQIERFGPIEDNPPVMYGGEGVGMNNQFVESKARGIVSDTVTKFAPEFNVVDDKDGPTVFFDGRNVTVNPNALENLDEYEVKGLSERAVVAAKAAPKDPIAASIIQQTDGYSAYNFDSATRKEIRKSLAKAHAVATENGMAPLAMDLGAKLFEYGGATDADVRKSMARGIPSDEEYLATVEAGDMEKAQQMVNDFIGEPNSGMTRLWRSDAAKVGTPVPNWMESTEELQGIKDASGRWFYKTKEEAERHMADFEGESLSFVDVPSESVESFNAKDNPFAGGYGKQGFEYFVPRQIAEARVSTAPVVRDDAGNVIPLSERFPGAAMPQSRARGVDLVAYVPRNRSGPRLAVEKLFAGFRSRGMVTEDAYNAFRDFEAFKKETESFIAFIAKDFTNVTNKLFGDGADNWLNYRVFSRDASGNVTVSKTGFKTAKDADNFATTNRYKDYIVSTGEELMNKALGSNGPTLREDVRDRIDQLTKKGLDDITKSIEAYKDEYLNYWNLVMMQPQPGMIDPDQIATLRERKEQWMKALQLRAAEQRQLVDDARKEAVRVALEDGANHIIAQQKFAKTYLPDELVYQIERTRDKIDEFSTRLTKIGWLMEGSELQMVIDGRMGVYVTRSYEAFETQDRANYVAFLDEAYRALYNPEQEYNKLAMERIMPMVRHIKAGITERRIQDLKRENEQRQLDEIMADLMADPRQVTQVDRIPGQPIEGTEYEQLLRAVARRELLLRRLKEKEDFIAKAVTSLGKSTFASNIGNARNRMRAIKKEAKRLYRERFAEQVEVANIMGAPNALRWTLMTEDEAHDIANVERSLSESPGNIAGSKIWTASISGRKHSTFHSAVSDDFRSNLDTITNSTASQTGFKGTGAGDWRSINDKILEYKENVPAFRRLFLGEINNPLMRVSETLTKQASLIAAGELYQNLADIGMKQGWLVEKELADTDTTKYAGWTSILTSSDNDQGYKDNPLKDLVADPVMVEAIRKLLSTNQPSNSAFKAISFTVGLVLFNLTAGSFKSIQRNLSSFIPFLLNTGLIGAMINPRRWSVVTSNFVLASKMVEQSMASSAGVTSGKNISNPILKGLDKTVTTILSGVAALRLSGLVVKGVSTSAGFVFRTKQKPTNEQFQGTYQRAVSLGVANDNVDKEAMSKMLNLEETLNRKPKDKKFGKLGKVLMLNEASEFGSYAFSLVKSTLKERSQLYGAPDDFTKIFAWLNEMDAQARIHAKDAAEYEKWRGKDGLFSDMPPEHVELAAEYTTDLVQSHSKVWAHITQFKKAGFGVLAAAFIAAKAEFYRNAFNSYRIAVKEMRSKNERERNAGMARFASAITAHFVYGNAIGYGLKMILKAFADDDEVVEDSIEIRNAISALGPEYAKNKNATYVVYKNGTFDWVDLSFSTPFAFVWETINAGKRGVSEAQVEDNIVWEITKEIVGENLGNFASPQIALDAFAVMRTGFDPIRGVKIWDSQTDNMGEKLMKSMGYFLKKVGSPGDVKSVSNIVNAARGIEENGRQYKLGTEVGSVFLGTSVRTFKIADIVEQKLAQGTNSLNNRITPLYNSVLTESNDVSMDDCESDTTEYYKTDVEVMTKMQKIWAAGNTLLADTPGGKKMLSAVIGGDKVKMESNRERALTTGKRHRVTLSDSMDRKVKGLGDKYDDPRHKVVKDTLKKLNEKP